jgi:Dimethyladenosine transferase (rRNA methylation)
MDFRKIFNNIPDEFDRWRPRYCSELFSDIINFANITPNKSVLEIGPGTGQASEPFIKTGCSYLAVELGEVFTQVMKNKFGSYKSFDIVNSDFETYNFYPQKFDLVFSAATIQWIPEEIAFSKTYYILNGGGTLAMFMTRTDYKAPNEALFDKIQAVYKEYFFPEMPYTCKMDYRNASNYGFIDFEYREYKAVRQLNSEEFTAYIGTHCDHIALREPYKTPFYEGIKKAILESGDKITLDDTIALYLYRKPLC